MMFPLKIAIFASLYVSFAGASSGDIFDAAYVCHADNEKEYCPTDATCKPDGDCSECDGKPDVDNKYHLCVSNTPRICQRQSKSTVHQTTLVSPPVAIVPTLIALIATNTYVCSQAPAPVAA